MASTLAALATLLAGANVVILAVLGGIWIQNYRTFRTGLTLGLVLFAAVILVENVAAIYSFLTGGRSTPTASSQSSTSPVSAACRLWHCPPSRTSPGSS
jgi:hypothetical protein